LSFTSACTTSALPSRNAQRQPAIEKLFVIEYSSTAHSLAPSACRMLGGWTPSKPDVGVREVVHHDHLALATEVDDPLHEREVDGGPGGVVRERDDEHRGLGQPMS
jgi:hypothetical protein